MALSAGCIMGSSSQHVALAAARASTSALGCVAALAATSSAPLSTWARRSRSSLSPCRSPSSSPSPSSPSPSPSSSSATVTRWLRTGGQWMSLRAAASSSSSSPSSCSHPFPPAAVAAAPASLPSAPFPSASCTPSSYTAAGNAGTWRMVATSSGRSSGSGSSSSGSRYTTPAVSEPPSGGGGTGGYQALGAFTHLRQPSSSHTSTPPSRRPPPPTPQPQPGATAPTAAAAADTPAAAAASPLPPTPPLQQQAVRQLSVQPEAAVYSGPSSRTPTRVTLRTIRKKYDQKEPLTMVTAYDYPSAVHVDAAGIDLLLVGDSVAMVVHGYDTTLPITLDEMITHCKAAARGARRAFLVGDLPFGCYETDVRDAVRSAVRMLKEGGMDAVKLEGGSPARVEAARAIVETGVAVMGHVGLTPQSVSAIGGFRPQAQVAEEALRVLDQAQALQRAGCFALVLECIPGPIAAAITRALTIPTIGIGAGGETSGQVLVYHDLLGMMSHPHHAKVTPKFCKQYAAVGDTIGAALQQYRQEVEERAFPGPRFSPYKISAAEVHSLAEELRRRGMPEAAAVAEAEAQRAAEARAQVAAAAAAVTAAAGGRGGKGNSA